MKSRAIVWSFTLAASLLGYAAIAGAQQRPQPVTIQKLTNNVYVTQGGAGSNIGVVVGKTGAFTIDAKISESSAQDALKEIANVNSLPITAVIITHSDGDHVNGLVAFPKGVTVIAQDACKTEMEASESTRFAAPKDYMPTVTYAEKKNMTIDGVKVELRHWAPAHTSGDTIVYLPQEGVVFTGDVINPTTAYTGIHPEKHGSIIGWEKTVNGMLALKADTFVPGHGPVLTRAQVQDKVMKVTARVDQIKALIAQGKSLPDIKTALGEPTVDPRGPNPNAPPPATFTDVVYRELSTKS